MVKLCFRRRYKLVNKEQFILDIMKKENESMRPGKIAELAGLSKEEVSEIIKNLKKKELIFSPKRCFYALIEEE